MSPELIQILVNSSGAAVVAGIAFGAFLRVILMFLKHIEKWNTKLDETIKDNNKSHLELAKQIQYFAEEISNQKNALKEVFEFNYEKTDLYKNRRK